VCGQGGMAVPCCISAPIPNQKLFNRVKLFSTMSDPGLQGWASYHSYGLNLQQHMESESVLVGVWHDKTLKEQEKKSLNTSRDAVQGLLTPLVVWLMKEKGKFSQDFQK